MANKYQLQNFATQRIFEDAGWLLNDSESPAPALLKTVYAKKQIEVLDPSQGIYRFIDWLPVHRILKGSSAPVTYKSEGISKYLHLDNLYITFNGYWPEKGANMRTCSFKETEAYSVCARIPEGEKRTLVVASAGNTARAFARVCSDNQIPLVLCVPYDNIDALWFDSPLDPCVQLVCTPSGSDYFDAIVLSDKICEDPTYFAEGGAKNVARRDGMATTVLSAAEFIGCIPDYYFQAIGSGTGTIAAWEANQRLLEDGRFGNTVMKLVPSQNYPFTPMYDAWKAHSRQLFDCTPEDARHKAASINAKVLSNRKPPYGIAGGLFDALDATNGTIKMATNVELAEAQKLFEELEGVDIHPAAGVATASLIQAVHAGEIDRSKIVMLNITGGGEKKYRAHHKICYLKPQKIYE